MYRHRHSNFLLTKTFQSPCTAIEDLTNRKTHGRSHDIAIRSLPHRCQQELCDFCVRGRRKCIRSPARGLRASRRRPFARFAWPTFPAGASERLTRPRTSFAPRPMPMRARGCQIAPAAAGPAVSCRRELVNFLSQASHSGAGCRQPDHRDEPLARYSRRSRSCIRERVRVLAALVFMAGAGRRMADVGTDGDWSSRRRRSRLNAPSGRRRSGWSAISAVQSPPPRSTFW